jgi:aryl-alcohol dehydrogenase-like predicted oxidoreductase
MSSKLFVAQRRLGTSGLSVSEICLGTMNFGGPTDETDALRIVSDAAANGVNYIDTADVYTEGRSEEITGRAIRTNRQHWILATKVANPLKDPQGLPMGGGLSRRWIMMAVEGSLKRLGVDHIDIYYTHKVDPLTPWSDVVRTFGDLIRAGKIRYWGLSNVRSWHIAEIVHQCRSQNVAQPITLQPYYNLFNRQPEVEVLPAANHYGLGVTTYSPVARGVLSGKYVPGSNANPESRAGRGDKRMLETEWQPQNLALAQQIGVHVAARTGGNGSLVHFAVQWVLNNAAISSVIAGPRTFEQWRGYVDYASYRWSSEDEALVDRLIATGHPSVQGYSDPQYKIEGRYPMNVTPTSLPS